MPRKFFYLAIGAALAGALLWLTRSIDYCGWDFHNSLWGPVSMLLDGQTPYTYNAPYGPYPGVWMPSTIGFFLPLGLISCTIASKLWLMASFGGFGFVIWLVNDQQLPSPWVLFVCLLVLFLFPPLAIQIILGQFSMLFVTLMIIVSVNQTQRWSPLILAIGLTKPQLAILIYPGMFVYVWRQRGFRAAATVAVSTTLCALLLTVPLFILHPGWVNDFFSLTFDNLGAHWNLPTLFVQLPQLFGSAGYFLWGMVLLTALVVSTTLWYYRDPLAAVVASLAFTPMVTPYASSWDFLLLIPAHNYLLMKCKRRAAQLFLGTGMILLYGSIYALRWKRDLADGSQWWIPPVLILVFIGTLVVEHLQGFGVRKPERRLTGKAIK